MDKTVSKTKIIIASIAAILVIIVGLLGTTYNSLQRKDENVNNKWSQVENQLQRRYDLIPNLVAVVKQYSDYETTTLERIVALRQDGSVESEKQADEEYKVYVKALTENYPELKAVEQYNDLMTNLEGTENRIAVARKDYNDAVTKLNSSIRTFPTNMIANMFGIEQKSYFEIDDNKALLDNTRAQTSKIVPTTLITA